MLIWYWKKALIPHFKEHGVTRYDELCKKAKTVLIQRQCVYGVSRSLFPVAWYSQRFSCDDLYGTGVIAPGFPFNCRLWVDHIGVSEIGPDEAQPQPDMYGFLMTFCARFTGTPQDAITQNACISGSLHQDFFWIISPALDSKQTGLLNGISSELITLCRRLWNVSSASCFQQVQEMRRHSIRPTMVSA